MYVITAVGALAVAIVAERAFWLYLRWRHDVVAIAAALDRGDHPGAIAAAGDGPVGDVLRAGLGQTDVDRAWEAMTAASAFAEDAIRARTPYLATVANLSTMLGLLGTVYGLMLAFDSLGDTGAGERTLKLSEGIATAMSTTALGLVVGLFAVACHAVLDARVRQTLAAMEAVASRVALAVGRAA